MERKKLIAPEGMVFDNGGTVIYLAAGQSETDHGLLSREDYEAALVQGLHPEEASIGDYRAALTELGVCL